MRDHDRAAPLGTGIYKVGGNYAASLQANDKAHKLGYACEFYLDAKEKKYIDECGAANFFGIKNNTYVTPKSSSILPSITNKSLMQLADDLGMTVERRQIPGNARIDLGQAPLELGGGDTGGLADDAVAHRAGRGDRAGGHRDLARRGIHHP